MGNYNELRKLQTTQDVEDLLNKPPTDNRAVSLGDLQHRGQARVSFWLQPRLHTWIETHILDKSGWTWRQFTEAAVAQVLSPEWLHPTWHANYVSRGVGNRVLDNSRMVGWTPFLDEIPHARQHIAGIEPGFTVTPDGLFGGGCGVPPATTLKMSNLMRQRWDQSLHGGVSFEWFAQSHAFLTMLGKLTPTVETSGVRKVRELTRDTPASAIARRCIEVHFERAGVNAIEEARFQVWREFCALKSGRQDHVPTQAVVYDRMKRLGLVQSGDQRVELHSASDAPLDRVQQYECGFWPEKVLKRFYRYDLPDCQRTPGAYDP